MYLRAPESVAVKLKDPQVSYLVESSSQASAGLTQPVIIRCKGLDFDTDLSKIKPADETGQDAEVLSCAGFCLNSKSVVKSFSAEVRCRMWFFLFLRVCVNLILLIESTQCICVIFIEAIVLLSSLKSLLA